MKPYKFVSYASWVIVAFSVLLLASLPFRFPNSTIDWKLAILFISPAVVLVGLLFVRQRLSKKAYLLLNAIFVGLAAWLVIENLLSPILLAIFCAGCLALYASPGGSTTPARQ